ncbi:hypothetical protein E2C01_041183 [Portunus trituberculatus]|uniref:Uncharacterized protein n=1 Tax=Portunus trituberculatus TaxID=210409 RepID=A0A5B7FQ06_PORTR|nr:hypothetical protein [Portunus trituberculatus]
MFSFRELVESMEKKTSENIAPISCPTRLPLSCSFHDALIDCEERTREQTSEHTAETSNEQTDGLGRHEGFFECSESQKELEHREATFWEEKVVHPSREEQTECTEKVDTEALWKVKKETNLRLIFKHGNVTMKPENYSVNDLFDIVKRNDFTLPLLNPVYIDASTTSLQSEHHITLDSKGKLKPNTGEELPTPASRRLNEDTNIQVDKSNQLKTNRKTIGRIPTIHKIRDHVCRSVKQKHSHNISEKEISIDEEVSISSIVVRKQESENKVENCIPRDLLSHERQCAEICHHETSVKETLISNDKPERLKAAAQGSWSSDLHYHTTDCWKNTTTATTPLLNNNQNGYSEHHRNTSSKRLPINEEYEWAALRLQEYEEVKTVENFKSASKHDAKDSDRIKEASRASQLVFHDPKSGTPENIAKNITTHFAQNSREKLSNLRNKKDSKEINIELVKDLQNHNMHERKRNRRRDPQSLAPAGYSKGDNDGPRASSPLPVGFRLYHAHFSLVLRLPIL